ncbi:MAG: cysteine desulfurase family protein [bacterium]|nr:cysteine desulfurase family protein [bacterium]
MKNIYLDNASARPVEPRVSEFIRECLKDTFGNPSSLHSAGLEAKKIIEEARVKVAELINAENENCIIFTSGATETNNLAIKGVAFRNKEKKKRVVSSDIEHISVLNSMKELLKNGIEFNTVPVNSEGIVDIEKLSNILNSDVVITSVMYANSEIGTIEPVKEISETVHKMGGYFHSDATAAAGHIPIDVQKDGIDLLTLSSNDMYGPQGAGALYIKPGIKIQPVILGGGQEKGIRSGTENILAIAGMGEASKIAKKEMDEEAKRLIKMRDELIDGVLKIENSYLTGHPTRRLPYQASFRFNRIEGESILLNMDMYGIQIATGSACSSKTLEPSHTLLAIGLKHEEAHGSMVLTLGRANNTEEIPVVVKAVRETVERLRKLSPL